MTARARAEQSVRLLILAALAACSGDAAGSSGDALPATITAVSGDAQFANGNTELPQAIRFLITDARGRAVTGVTVNFSVTLGDGTLSTAQQVSDSDGAVETHWKLGIVGGVQELQARVGSNLLGTASAETCLPGDCYPEARLEGPLSEASLLALATYDSSGQTVHPDVVRGRNGNTAYWLAITPYPGGDVAHENPSIFRSSNGATWSVPAGVINPLAVPSAITGYLSDPDIVYNSTDQKLWLYYRSFTTTENTISVIRSTDGSSWDHPTIVLTTPAHQVVSPTIVRGAPHAAWQMWAVNAGVQGCSAPSTSVERRTSLDGINWGAAVRVDLAQPGQTIWHIDVEWIPALKEYWALYNTYPTGSTCSTHSLYLARSSDGAHWTTMPSPIVRSGLIPAFADVIYRSTFLVDPSGARVTLWMSGAIYGESAYVWRTATVSTTTASLLAIASVPASPFSTIKYRKLPPPEGDIGQ